jgi:mono/diheme cytochrome c family protein
MPKRMVLIISILVGLSGSAALWLVATVSDDEPTSLADISDRSAVTLGAAVYREHCAACHGLRLEGQPNWRVRFPDGRLPAPPHDATGHTWHHPDQHLFDITKYGTAALVGGDYNTDMAAFGDRLSDRQIWAALAYIKSQWPEEIRQRQARMNERRR